MNRIIPPWTLLSPWVAAFEAAASVVCQLRGHVPSRAPMPGDMQRVLCDRCGSRL